MDEIPTYTFPHLILKPGQKVRILSRQDEEIVENNHDHDIFIGWAYLFKGHKDCKQCK